MADGLQIEVGVILNTQDIQNQLDSIKNGKVKIDANISEANKTISDFKKSLSSKSPAKIVVDVLKGTSNSNINSYIDGIQNKYQSNPIKIAFTVDDKATQKNIDSAIQGMQQSMQKQMQQAAKQTVQQNTSSRAVQADIPISSSIDKYTDELNNAIKRYQDAFTDGTSKVSGVQVMHDELTDSYRAAVQFNNAIGETTNVMFKLQSIIDDDGKKKGEEWVTIGQRFSATFKDAEKDIDKTLNTLQSFQTKLNTIQSKGFERTNQLSGDYAKPVEESIDRIQKKINDFTSNASGSNGIAMTTDEIRQLKQELSDLDNLRIKQQNTQYQARQLSATDISSQIPILKNDVAALENKFKSMGFGDKFKEDIANLKDMLKTLGQDGGSTIQQFNSQMKLLKSEANNLQTRPLGQGLMESKSISDNQLVDIKSINKILNQQVSTDGIQEAKNKVKELADAYQNLQNQMQSPKISNQRMTDLKRQESELDQQLKTYQALAKNLNGDAKSQQWVSQQNAGIANMKSQFEEYQQEISKTIELTPELQARMDSLSVTMSGDKAVDVANWQEINNQFKELKANIDQYKASLQGQASQMAIGIDTNQLQQIEDTINRLNSVDEQYSGTGVQTLKQNLQELATEYQNVMTQLQSADLSQEQFEQLSQKVQELGEQLKQAADKAKIFEGGIKNDEALEKYEQNAETVRMKFEQLQNQYENLAKSNPQIAQRFEEVKENINGMDPTNIGNVSREVNNLGRECQNASGQSAGLRGALQDAFGGVGSYFARFTSSFFIISKAIRGIKSMVNEVKSVDSSLVELQKVTSLTGQSLDQFVDKAYKVGEGLGRTGQDVVDAVTTFSRAGYDLNEATELAQSALVMTNVGVDIPNTEAAASDMISILKAYDKQANESMDVIDKLYNVANKEPLDFGNITDMLVTAGGTLAQTGTSLEETMGLLTGAFTTMRDTSVANGLIMISQRLRGVKEDGEAIEEADFIPKLKSMFADVGIDIEDSNGELRSTFDILQDLSGVWDQLSSKQKQYFGEKVAGNRQVKTLNAIMQNWDVVADTIDKANNSQGEALEGNEMYMNSIGGKITQLKSAWQELATTTFNSDFIKGFVDIGTAVVKLTTNIGGLAPVLTTVLGLFIAIKGANIAEAFTKIGSAIVSAISGVGSAATVMSGWIGIAIAAAGAIYGIVTAINNASSTTKKLDVAKDNFQQQQTKVQDLNTQLEDTRKRIEELNGKELTIIEQNELETLKTTNDELQRQLDLENKLLEVADKEQREAAVKDVDSYENSKSDRSVHDYDGRVSTEKMLDIVGYNYSGMSDYQKVEALSTQWVTKEQMTNITVEALQSAREEYKKETEALLNLDSDVGAEVIQQAKERVEALGKEVDKYERELGADIQTLQNKVSGISESDDNPEFTEIKKRIEELGEIYSEDTTLSLKDQFNAIAEKYPEVINDIKESMSELGEDWSIDSLLGSSNGFSQASSWIIEQTNGLIDSLSQLDGVEKEAQKHSIGDILEQTFMTGEGAGNVDVLNRKVLSGKDMLEKYKNEFEGFEDEVVTYFSSGKGIEIGDVPFEFTITPVGPNGEVYSEDEIDKYIDDLVGKSSNIQELLENDKAENGGYNILVHYTPVIDGDYESAAATEEYFGTILHVLSSIFDSDTTIQDAINELGDGITFDTFVNEVATKLNMTHDKVEQLLKELFLIPEGEIEPQFEFSPEKVTAELFTATDSYKALTKAMTEQQKAGVLSAETWNALLADEGLKGVEEYLRMTADGYALNTEGIYDFIKAKQEEDKLKAVQGIMEQQKAIEDLTKARGELTQAQIDAGEAADIDEGISAAESEIQKYSALIAEIEGATSALERYRAASKTANQDAEHTEGQGAFKTIKDSYKEGKIGTDDFKEAMSFMLGDDWVSKFEGNVDKAYKAAKEKGDRYFGDDDAKSATNFANDLVSKGLAQYDDTGNLSLIETDLGNIAEAFGMSEDAAESLFGLLNSYSFGSQFEFDRPITSADELAAAQEKLKKKTEEREQAEKDLAAAQKSGDSEKIAEAQSRVDSLTESENNLKTAIDVANEAMANGEFEAPMSIDEALTKIQELQTAVDTFNKNNITIPVEITGQYDELVAFTTGGTLGSTLNKDGSMSNTISIQVDGVEDAKEKMSEIDTAWAQIQALPSPLREEIEAKVSGNYGAAKTGLQEYIDMYDEMEEGEKSATITLDVGGDGPVQIETFNDKITQVESRPYTATVNVEEDATNGASAVMSSIQSTVQGVADALSAVVDVTANTLPAEGQLAEFEAQPRTIEYTIKTNGEVEFGDGTTPEDVAKDTGGVLRNNGSGGWNFMSPFEYFTDIFSKGLSNGTGVSSLDEMKHTVTTEVENGEIVVDNVDALTSDPNLAYEAFQNSLMESQVAQMTDAYASERNAAIEAQANVSTDTSDVTKEVEEAVEEGADKANPEVELKPDSDGLEEELESEDLSANVDVEGENIQELGGEVEDAIPDEVSVDVVGEYTPPDTSGTTSDTNVTANVTTKVDSSQLDSLKSSTESGMVIDIGANGAKAESEVNKIDKMGEKSVTKPINANTFPAKSKINSLDSDIKKTRTMTVNIKTNGAKDLPYAKGTNNAVGGPSLVDEKGAELIEHVKRGTYELGSNNGPRITVLDKGDVVHTATETKRILARASAIGGAFRNGLNKAKSIIGDAFASGTKVTGSVSLSSLKRVASAARSSGKKNSGTSSKTQSDKKSQKKFEDWASNLFDWVEIRLDRLKTITNTWLLDAANAIGSIAKNNEISNAIKSIDDEISATEKAYDKYMAQADTVAKKWKLNKDIVKKIQDGSIKIESYNKNTQDRIKEYQKWYDKAMDCVDALTDLNEQQKELAAQKLENIVTDYEDRATLVKDARDKSEANRDLLAVQGKADKSSNYDADIKAEEKSLQIYKDERKALSDELNNMINAGYITVGDETWQKYTEKLNDIDTTIIKTQTDIQKLKDEANEVKFTQYGYQLDALTATASRNNDEMDLVTAQGSKSISSMKTYYDALIANMKSQNTNLETQNAEYRKAQTGLDVLSDKYQDIEKKIQDNISAINSNKKSIQDYTDQINQITFTKYSNSLNDLSDGASRLNDSISFNVAKGIEQTRDAYDSLIKNGQDQIKNLNNQKKAYQDLMNAMVKFYGNEAMSSEKYIGYADKVKDLESSIRSLDMSIIEWNKDIQNLAIEKLGWTLDSVAASAERMNNLMSLHAAQGVKETSEAYKNLINNGNEQIKILEDQNKQYKEMQKNMNIYSSAYQELQASINSNLSEIENIKVSQEEWNDAIIDIGINDLKKYKDSISKTNDEYDRQKALQEAILKLEKARDQKKVRTYIEGQGFVYQSDQEELKDAQENLEKVVKDQLMGKIDDLISALEESKNDTNVYDANGNLLGSVYNTPQLGTLTDILSNYYTRGNSLDIDVLKDSLGKDILSNVDSATTNSTALSIGDIIVNEAKDGNELAKAIVDQFPNALLQALYKK